MDSRTILAYNYFMIWAGLQYSCHIMCDVTSKMVIQRDRWIDIIHKIII